ncbi:hypothetical protein [Streptomyces synnematoformans]|uniref:Uncharacterized protein n=1 Tax=Streptomyces synnematoformans TaxID=415721 RepID=A0ABN2Z147_9ACTN
MRYATGGGLTTKQGERREELRLATAKRFEAGEKNRGHRRGPSVPVRAERTLDRDRHGVLWARLAEAPGVGRPDFRSLHSHRQRRAMLGMLCQVCGAPAGRTARGWLFLLQLPGPGEPPAHWPGGGLSAKPPVCVPCARLALRHCPRLTDPLAVRVRKPRVWGVFGGLITPDAGGTLVQSPTDEHLPYGHPATRWFLASQLVVELRRCRSTARDRSLNWNFREASTTSQRRR